MMESTFKLGRLFGIPIGIHYTWFLVFFMLTYLLADRLARFVGLGLGRLDLPALLRVGAGPRVVP